MSDLDDYNRRVSLGDMAGAPRSLGDVAGQMQLDAQRRAGQAAAPGGASVDVSTRRAGVLLAVGLLLAVAGAYAAFALKGGAAIAGGVAIVVGAGMALFFGFGLLVVALHRVGSWRLLAALVAGGLAWGLLAPWLGSIGLPVPGWIAGIVAVGLVLVGRGFWGRGTR
jgi:hypothetical protein